MFSKYFFRLETFKSQKKNNGGSLTYITSKKVPGFSNISFSSLNLNKRGSLEPIWHPNANKIGYCIEGNHLVSIRTPGEVETFTVKKGEIFFIPQGYIHHIENIGETEGIIHFVLNNEHPETMNLYQAISSLSDNVFNSIFNTSPHFKDGLTQSKNEELIKTLPALNKMPSKNESSYKFDIGDSNKAMITKGGYLQVGTKAAFPTLQGLGLLRFGLNPKGIVEPHWHTNAGELVYIIKGKTRITILSPDGHVDVLEVKGGEGAFAPASHFHNIENIGPDEAEAIAFFSHAEPDFIGIGEVVGSYSNELLASVFNTSPEYFNALNKTEKPLVILPV